MPTALITGSNRGIGLEYARQYAADGWHVIATCRNPDAAADLKAITGDLEIRALDVADFDAIEKLGADLKDVPIDVLVLNAGTNPQPLAPPTWETDFELWPEAFRINTMAPVKMTITLADNVAASDQKIIAAISSGAGSVSRNPGGNNIYRSTKAALNLVCHGMANEYKPRGITIVALAPGWVLTDMGRHLLAKPKQPSIKPYQPEESVGKMRQVIANLTLADGGRFINPDGDDIPW